MHNDIRTFKKKRDFSQYEGESNFLYISKDLQHWRLKFELSGSAKFPLFSPNHFPLFIDLIEDFETSDLVLCVGQTDLTHCSPRSCYPLWRRKPPAPARGCPLVVYQPHGGCRCWSCSPWSGSASCSPSSTCTWWGSAAGTVASPCKDRLSMWREARGSEAVLQHGSLSALIRQSKEDLQIL